MVFNWDNCYKFFLKRKDFFIFIFLLLVTFLIWFKVLSIGFLSDDYDFLYHTSLTTNFLKYFQTNSIGSLTGGSYTPVFNLFFGLEYKLFHFSAVYYHLTSLVAYCLTGFFIYKFISKITNDFRLGFLSGLLFLFLANHVEVVSWVGTQVHLLASLFFIIGIYFYYNFIVDKKLLFYLLALLFLVLSVFTKEITILFPFVLLLLELFFNQNKFWPKFKASIVRLLPFLIFVLLFLGLRYQVVGYVFGYYGQTQLSFTLWPKIIMLSKITVNMFVSYPYRELWSSWLMTQGAWSLFILVFFLGLSYFFQKNRQNLYFLILSYLLISLPFLNLLYNPSNDSGERYAYLVSIFFVSFIVIFIYELCNLIFSQRRKLWFYLFITLFLITAIVQLQHKLNFWTTSSQVSAGIINQIALYASENENSKDYFMFVGLPDNVSGAEAMRNAVTEALFIDKQLTLTADRVPIYLDLKYEDVNKICVRMEKQENSWLLLSEPACQEHIFTGFPTYEKFSFAYKLLDFVPYNNTGKEIMIKLSPAEDIEALLTEKKFDRLVLAYFDGQKMNFMPVDN